MPVPPTSPAAAVAAGGPAPAPRPGPRRVPVLPGGVVAVLGAAGVWGVWRAFVLSATGRALDVGALDGAAFGRNQLWTAAEQVLDGISVPLLAAVLLATTLLAVLRRRVVLAVQVALLMGGANLTTQVLKRWVLDRPDVGIGDHLLASLPSGHTTAAASVAVALLLVVPRRVRPAAAVAGTVYTLATGVSTLVAGWHRPSDVVAAVLVVLAWAGVASVAGALLDPDGRAFGDPTGDRPRQTAVAVAVLAAGAAAAGVAAALALAQSTASLAGGLGTTRELVTAYAGGALGITAVTCATFAALLVLRRTTEAAARRR
ncbi:phosphatase PAP2 family protein [Actinotalea solisilvae]|uniref:phosphatase PAP2 family protein n=1 Tax=Actinotalea solisilvae TaxID=2072922 RepID=UPI0027DDCFD8|nr:phosphatase PAP2 family protein [Actinotalea solisilvae]